MLSASTFTQRFVNTSSGEAELKRLSLASKFILFYVGIGKELDAFFETKMLVTDSKSCLSTAELPVSKKLKFLSRHIHFVKETSQTQRVKIVKVPRNVNLADGLTRLTSITEFTSFSQGLYEPFKRVHLLS